MALTQEQKQHIKKTVRERARQGMENLYGTFY